MDGAVVDCLGNVFEKDDIVLYMKDGTWGPRLRVVVEVSVDKRGTKVVVCKNLDNNQTTSFKRSIRPLHLLNITDVFRVNALKYLKSYPEYTEHFLKTHGEELQENHNEES